MHKILFTLTAGLLLAAAANPASAMLIDNFDYGDGYVTATAADTAGGTHVTDTAGSYPDIVGGYRELQLPNSQDIEGTGSATMAANPSNSGYLSFSLDAMTKGSGILTWDGNGAGLGGVDMTDGGLSSFVSFDILAIDQGDIDLNVFVTDSNGEKGHYTLSGAGVGTHQFDFLSFSNSGALDFTSIDSISLDIIALDDASDLVLDQIFTGGSISVPAPQTTLALLGLGLILIGFGVRRRTH